MMEPEAKGRSAAWPRRERSERLYEQVAQGITQLIQQGTLRPGTRVPSVRKLVAQKSVSVSTVLQAYQLLERRGLIEARPQSGFYVRVARWRPAPEPEIFHPAISSKRLNMGGLVMEVVSALNRPGLVNLGAAVPAPELLPNLELHRALARATRREPVLANRCDPSIGLPALRREIARLALEAGCTLAPEEIVITNGLTEALHLSLRAVARQGDTIAIESPTYFGILQILEMLGLRACEIPTHPQEGVCLEELARRLKRTPVKACVFMTNFSNPLGSCMPDARKRQLAELLAARGIPLVEDDIYGSLAFGPGRPRVAKSFDHAGTVLLCGSLSKTLAPGYRIGWVASGRFQAKVHLLKHTSSIGNPLAPQLALAEFLATGGYERHLRRLCRTYEESMERMSLAVSEHFPIGTRITRPRGGQVLWVELPGTGGAVELYQSALSSGISVAPGPIFSARQQYRNCIRLNYANVWSEKLEGAVAKLGTIARQVVEGAQS
jgi:DNA-binding transcriptional MocR family regulator